MRRNSLIPSRERGAALLTVLTLMGALLALSITSARLALLGERGARNARDLQSAFHAAEAALVDAEADLMGTAGAASRRSCAITGFDLALFAEGCGGTGERRGLCAAAGEAAPDANASAFDTHGAQARYATFGEFTGRTYNAGAGAGGAAPAPRYIVEAVPYTAGFGTAFRAFRVTAVGYGPGGKLQAALQTIVVKPVQAAGCGT